LIVCLKTHTVQHKGPRSLETFDWRYQTDLGDFRSLKEEVLDVKETHLGMEGGSPHQGVTIRDKRDYLLIHDLTTTFTLRVKRPVYKIVFIRLDDGFSRSLVVIEL